MTRTVPRSSRLLASMAMVLTVATGCGGSSSDGPPVLPIGGDFVLTDHSGQRFESTSLRGKVVLVFFGYSFCPDFCPTTLSKLAAVTRRLGDAAPGIKTLYITVDPERDTPAVLKDDLANFKLDALGLTGSRAALDSVVNRFGARYEIVPTPESVAKYTVSHTTSVYVLDRRGRVRFELPYESSVEEILMSVSTLLKERP
ncbi:MAG: SCO family protein [Gemmatimonas sp.]